MRRGGIEPPAPRRCWMATENFTTKPSAQTMMFSSCWLGWLATSWMWTLLFSGIACCAWV
ncbi:uncharacterized protein CTRU02_210872 [Colletotrichum truncatum]|uniref:Uncharacterized protein n=1 Tax=Colletotrichum truncatum TaxID=5467 RepID=A0ACC3YQ67_COLTU|nr:uncharacterized protein CTRU02_03644 [Colletotrichum truncatum]KAF6796666.1 hypothetical protein CTRU02_03644 [Colletotrichum truncatum]